MEIVIKLTFVNGFTVKISMRLPQMYCNYMVMSDLVAIRARILATRKSDVEAVAVMMELCEELWGRKELVV